MSSLFEIREHTVECQHVREYPRATALSQNEILHLAVKQYIPLDNLEPKEGDVTIIGAHANGFPKASHMPKHKISILNIYRNYMNHYGKTSTPVPKPTVSEFEGFG